VYALLFADAGLSTAQVSSLFALWSVVSFVVEIPSGALADVWSRRRLYAAGEFLTAASYACWLLWPSYMGFALGFILWGAGGSLASGSLEALVYDEVGEHYAPIIGRAETIAILAMLGATLLAAPALALGGYALVGGLSIAIKTVGGALALRLPENRVPENDEKEGGYVSLLQSGLTAVVKSPRLAWAVAIAALVAGFTALDEYLPLLGRDKGAPTAAVPMLFAVTALAMAAGSALAGRYPALGAKPLALVLGTSAAALAAGALVPHVLGMIAVSAAFGGLQFTIILTGTRLQESITGPARSTVLSVSGFASEVVALALYAMFGLDAPLTVLFALCGLPLLLTAAAIVRPSRSP
jgi:hypothetical protein